jgi:SPX domain protein involved in polyphosphate accumulation
VTSLLRGELDLEQQLEKLRAGGASASDVERTRSLAGEVGAELEARALAPALRTVYYRTAFQLATSNAVRVSLDTQLRMVDERGFAPGAAAPGGGARGTGWCRRLDASPPLAPGELIEFPFAILEIKLQDAAPDWVAELLASGRLVQCTKFSKFLHGARVCAALLLRLRMEASCLLPVRRNTPANLHHCLRAQALRRCAPARCKSCRIGGMTPRW